MRQKATSGNVSTTIAQLAAANAQQAAQAARKGTEAQVTATMQLPLLYGGLAGHYGETKSAAAVFSDAVSVSAGIVW